MSTRSTRPERASALAGVEAAPWLGALVEEVARVAHAKREILLRAYRHLGQREDLEDCYSQATVELLAYVRRGGRFAGRRHVANTLELRFESRIRDLRRALGGRSPLRAALATAVPLEAAEHPNAAVADPRADIEQLVFARTELRRVKLSASALTADQRLVLASQLADIRCADFCSVYGWSPEKYRKVAQRGRARLKQLVSDEQRQVTSLASRCKDRDGRGWQGLSL